MNTTSRLAGLAILLLCCLGSIQETIGAETDSSRMRRQFIEYHIQNPPDPVVVKGYLESQRDDGTWADVDYTSQRTGSWETLDHLIRLLKMAAAYVNPHSAYHEDPKMQAALLAGLSHWVEKNYNNSNWWHRSIGVPENLLATFVLLGDELPGPMLQEAREGPLSRLHKLGSGTGQNKVWIAGNWFLLGLLTDDAAVMKAASDAIWSELVVSTGEGIQPDWSFHQHGPQLQFGNYGRSFGGCMVQWGCVLRGTDYAISEEKRLILRNYLTQGPAWTLWRGLMDFSACGRQYSSESVGNPRGNYVDIRSQIARMIQIDPEYQAGYEALLEEPSQLLGHKFFWRSDFAVHRRPDWYASVKMSSTRVVGTEVAIQENIQGLHNGDGVMLLYQHGKEYEDIAPLWDWRRLPGTTCDQGLKNLTPKGYDTEYGGSDFVGGLTDGETCMAAMIYLREGLTARKAWFFGKDTVICLGTGIGGETKGPIYTSIQQSLLKGPITTSSGELAGGTHNLSAGTWVHHDGIGYHLLDATTLKSEVVGGNWRTSYPAYSDRPAEGPVFSLWMDHGTSPQQEASYAYVLHPRTKASEMAQVIKTHPARILSNTKSLQAVENTMGVQAVFYEPGKLTMSSGTEIAVDAPCLLSLNNKQLVVADPTQKLESLTVKVDERVWEVILPVGANAGARVSVER
ncbi:polysaccharide lyase family 8 super-sandwich domain-containing protein [Luteolibacter algae]|uniref:Polysaccharide lyase family 8 super-sandwich domain-containing protein n=1 Tax=Luteolibacter algae TaxID=454151 RepID=A0ABW5DCV9_9BACT